MLSRIAKTIRKCDPVLPTFTAACCVLLALLYSGATLGADTVPHPFDVRVDRSTFAQISTFGRVPVTVSGKDQATASAQGKETSECKDYGRVSTGTSTVSAEVTHQSRNGVSLHIKGHADAKGGHFRRCVQCILDNCVGFLPEDTTTTSRATANVRILLEGSQDYPTTEFDLVVASLGSGIAPTIVLAKPEDEGRTINAREEVTIRSGRGQIYYVDVSVDLAAVNTGECCEESKSTDFSVDLRWSQTPILYAARHHQPYIVGGETTGAFENVGVFLVGGRPHCTGTVLGPHTILTAAHCVWDHEAQRERIKFVLGPNANQWTDGPFKVRDWAYPQGEMPGFRYNPILLEDDIALVYVDPAIKQAPVRLPRGALPWKDFVNNGTQFTFVGYGLDRIDGQLSGIGAKREGTWGINKFNNRQVFFSVNGLNTCKGDSGGPGFLVDKSDPQDRRYVQVMIASAGDWHDRDEAKRCTQGVQTRLDAYLAWLEGKVR